MPFDPDAYLRETESSFDPDEYLKNSKSIEDISPKTTAGKALALTKEFIPLPPTPTEPLGRPTSALEKYGSLVKEAGIAPIEKGIDTLANLPLKTLKSDESTLTGALKILPKVVSESIVKPVLRVATPFTPSEFANLMAYLIEIPLFLRSTESAIGRLAESTAGKTISPIEAGTGIKESFEQTAGKGLDEMEKRLKLTEEQKSLLEKEALSRIEQVKAKRAEAERFRTPEFRKELEGVSSKFGEPLTLGQFGQSISEEFGKKLSGLREVESKAWDVSKEDLKHPGSIDRTLDTISEKYSKPESGAFIEGRTHEGGRLQRIPISSFPPELAGQIPQSGFESPLLASKDFQAAKRILDKHSRLGGEFTVNDMKEMRTQLGGIIDWNMVRNDVTNHNLIDMFKSLTEDMDRSLTEAGSSPEKLSKARASTKELYDFIDSVSSKEITKLKEEPSKILDKLIQSNSPERVNQIMSQYDKPVQDKLKRAFLDKLREESGEDPDKFSRAYNSYTGETKQALFGDQKPLVDSLDNFQKNLYKIKELEGYDVHIKDLKSKVDLIKKDKPIKMEDLVGKKTVNLSNLIRNTDASDIIDKISKSSVEDVKLLTTVLDKKGRDILERGFLRNILDKARITTPYGTNYDLAALAREMHSYTDEFYDALYGKNSDLVKTLRDITRFTVTRKMGDIFLEADRSIQYKHFGHLQKLFNRYRLPKHIKELTAQGLRSRPVRDVESVFKTLFPEKAVKPFAPLIGISGIKKSEIEE